MRQDTDQIIQNARKRAKKKARLYKEFIVFTCISILLMLINAFSGGPPWFQWAVFPWGITILMRSLLLRASAKTEHWEAKEIAKELKKRGISSGEVAYEDAENDDFDLDDLPPRQAEPLRQKRWDDRDLV